MVLTWWELTIFFVGVIFLLVGAASKRGAYMPWVREHATAMYVIGVIAIFVGVAFVGGVVSVGNQPTVQIQPTATNYQVAYTLGDFQTLTGYGTTALLTTKLTTVGGVNAVEALLPTTYGTANYGGTATHPGTAGDFLASANGNITVGYIAFTVNLARTDMINANMTFSVSVTNIPVLTNTTTSASPNSFSVISKSASTGQYEVYFNNATQISNVFVHYINVGGSYKFFVNMSTSNSIADIMTVYGTQTVDLTISFGTGQSISVPVELVRTS